MARTEKLQSEQDNWIGCLTYQSTATSKPSAAELRSLAHQARTRNRSVGVTGMLLFEEGRFLQTLEGPPEGVEAIWSSVARDQRHSEIEVLSRHMAPARLFTGWDLFLSSKLSHAPDLADAAAGIPPAMAKHVRKAARHALDGDDIALNAMIAALAEQGWTSAAVLNLLIEPTARALGDAWLADDCSELDLTIALSMLQLAGHAVRYETAPQAIRSSRYSILLATAPGEPHMLGTALLADQFTDAGWEVEMTFPDSEEALLNQLRAQRPDALDIGLSDALFRQQSLIGLRSVIEHSRSVPANHPTVVSVGGRLFAEAAATAATVGADHARTTAAGASVRMAELVRQSRQF
ncbi:BLUF domain-containing protein [Erythrobacter sp. R86502]|uniref:BLUF domain-containing protein n=1 Tax=Erythrobacter sp. R86502 TaxID=3093846 RepID=UPI0036D249EF